MRDSEDTPRCRQCGHLITAEESISSGLGRDCRKRLRVALRGAKPEVIAAFAVALGAA
ncbi:DUF6011 domain-containing protein [Nocardioides xinjiangensis]|uniref:DUF6011 domain-containing protein n=1 Tax=Nocardioides xinjiangensis TaxID=2817376 RepID=UPI0035B3C807